MTTRSSLPLTLRLAAYCRKSSVTAASAETSVTLGQDSRALGQDLQSRPASTQHVTNCLFNSANGATTMVTLAPASIAGTMKTKLFPPPVGSTATSGLCFAAANLTASSCWGDRNWATSSRSTARSARRIMSSFFLPPTAAVIPALSFSSEAILARFRGGRHFSPPPDSAAPLRFEDEVDGGGGSKADCCCASQPRNLCQRRLTRPSISRDSAVKRFSTSIVTP